MNELWARASAWMQNSNAICHVTFRWEQCIRRNVAKKRIKPDQISSFIFERWFPQSRRIADVVTEVDNLGAECVCDPDVQI